jgi:hypothetical protein
MTSVFNLFSNFDDLSKKKSINDYASDYKAGNSSLNNYSPAMTQGQKFQKYQRGIKKNLEKKTRQKKVKEGFQDLDLDNMNLYENGLARNTHNIVTTNEPLVHQSTLQNLRQQYDDTLREYNDLFAKYTGATNEYISRVSSNNPYLGKNVRFSNGAIFYVTNQGVAKLYPNTDIYNSVNGMNGCPPSGYIELNTVWDDSYYTPGTIIPSNPDLLVGTPMVAGQSCGNEGKNIFVNTMVSNPKSSYIGCYNDEPPPIVVNFVPQFSSYSGVNSFYATASSVYFDSDTYASWHAFDRNPNTYWHSNCIEAVGNYSTSYDATTGVYIGINGLDVTLKNGTTTFIKGEYLMLHTPSEYTLSGYSLLGRQDCCGNPNGRDPNTWYIVGNKTGVGWFEVDYRENQSFNWQKKSYNDTASNPYSVYAIIVTVAGDAASGNQATRYCVQIAEWELFTSVASTDNSTRAMIWNPDVIGFVTPEQCQSYATENGYKYYGLQAPNPNGTAACLVGIEKSRAQMYGEAASYTPINLWSSNTNNGTSATLNMAGSLSVLDSSGKSIFATNSEQTTQPNYVGCYNDTFTTAYRAMPLLNYDYTLSNNNGDNYDVNYDEAYQIAIKNNYKYFSTQDCSIYGGCQAGFTNDLAAATAYGVANNCVNGGGGPWSNAIYSTGPPDSEYFLILQDDGNMCIYKGTSPSSMTGYAIFCTMTNGKQQAANPQFAASKGKYGQNWIGSGSTLAPGDFIGSTNGNMYLMMQTDGNLVLNTFSQSSACSKNSNGITVGGPYINAVYENSEVGITNNIAKLAYVDENANLFNYPFDNTKYGNSYSEISRGMDTPYNDIPGAAYGNASFESCKTTCDNIPDCAGFVTNKAGDVCWPKNGSMYPYSTDITANSDRIIYIRNKTPNTPPIGVSNTTNNIDTIQYQSYVNGGNIADKYGLAKLTSVQKQQLEDKLSQLNLLSQQITNYTNTFGTNSQTAQVQMGKNITGVKDYLTDLKVTDKKINNFGTNVDLILNDSDIVALQKNYDYLFWTILAAGTVLVAINIVKK